MQRTPLWLNDGHLFEMECIYKYCAELRTIGLDYHVDHIVPMQGKKVSGLHAPWNLQVISAQENLSKGNKHYV
jgi:5-methylcytosine-specific restriction endonuclease McrA